MKVDKISKIIKRIVGAIFIIGILLATAFTVMWFVNLMPVAPDSEDTVLFEVKNGWGVNTVITELEKEGLIKDDFILKIYSKLNNYESVYAGNYKLSKSMSAVEIIESMYNGKNIENETITVTFVEGKKFPYYVTKMCETFGFNEEDVYALTTNEEYLNKLINDYWFIGTEILNKDLYYPLEGYLFADTYEFKKNSTAEEVIERMLKQMDEKLSVYKEEIQASGKGVHTLLTMASMVELEAVTAEDRLQVAGVFYNRLKKNIPMGSDVTTYYAEKKEMTESLYMSEINACNAYNTRGDCAKLFPVGPICSASYSSITAAITPEESDYYYFVADINNKVYFSKTNDEQLKVIRNLRNQGLWPE